MESSIYPNTRPPYLEEIAGKPYYANYTSPILPKYDGITGNAREHIKRVSSKLERSGNAVHEKFFALEERLMLSDLQHEKQRVFEGLLEYIRGFRDLSLLCYDPVEEERLEDVCISSILYEYRPYLENLQISSFTRLVKATRRTSMSMRKPSKELYSILEVWVKDGVVTLPKCKHEPTEEEKRNPLYCRYHRRCDHHTMDYYAFRNIFHNRVAKGDLVIKVRKRVDLRMCRPKVVRIFFMGREDPMEEEVKNMASSILTPPSLVDEEMLMRIQHEDKIHSFPEGIGLKPMARREVTQAPGPLYVTAFLGASRIKRALVDTSASTNIFPLPTFDALGIPRGRIILEPMQVARIEALQQSILGHMSLDLMVGPIQAPTLMHVMEGNTSYHIILGRPWLKVYKAVASTYHQCVKAIWRNKQVVIEATKIPFNRVELHFAEAALYQEYELKGENRILPFNPIALQTEEENDGEMVELEKPPKIRRVVGPDG
nr:hypothetical protein CFP56_08538 [Quercus suber]